MEECEFDDCVRCEVHVIWDCPCVEVIDGKLELPTGCWRLDLMKKDQDAV
jgi:hypothetical protein